MKIKYLTEHDFDALINLLELIGVECPENNPYAFTMTTESGSTIFYNNDCGLDNDCKQIVIQHERAHLAGIDNEEDSDRFALARLNKRQKKILIENWKGRHGHEYPVS